MRYYYGPDVKLYLYNSESDIHLSSEGVGGFFTNLAYFF